MLKVKNVFMVIMISLLAMDSGCWFYSFKGTLPPHIKTIAIPLFGDQTAEFNIQQIVTDQIRVGFIQENILRLAEEENTNSILYGVIQSIQDRPLVFKEGETGESVTEYRITLKIEVEWYDNVEAKSIFKKSFTGYSEYDPTGATDRTRDIALSEAVDNITEDIVNQILSGW